MIEFRCPQCENRTTIYLYDEKGNAQIPDDPDWRVLAWCAVRHHRPVKMEIVSADHQENLQSNSSSP